MIKLAYHDDGKQKWESHEIYLKEDDFYNNKYDVWSHNLFNIHGYGETKEKALENFKKKFQYIMDEWRAFETILMNSNVFEVDIVNVDCLGKEIKD